MRKRTRRMHNIPTYKKMEGDTLGQMLFSSILGMVVCAVCLVGLTMAWFSASVEHTSGKFQTSNFVMNAKVEYRSGDALQPVEQNGGRYKLEGGKEYIVTLTGEPERGLGGGYGIFTLSGGSADVDRADVTYITDSIHFTGNAYNSIVFTIKTNVSCELKIGYGWGASGEGEEEVIGNDDVVEFYSPVQAAMDASPEEASFEEEQELSNTPGEEVLSEDDSATLETETFGAEEEPAPAETAESEEEEAATEGTSASLETEFFDGDEYSVPDETAETEVDLF